MKKLIPNRLGEKLPVWVLKLLLNLWPPFLGAGVKLKKASADFRQIEMWMKLRWYNRNYVGTHFGGSLYAMTDPFPMLIIIKFLGKKYIVWDKAGKIEYKKPGRGLVKASFNYSEEQLQFIKQQTDANGKYTFDHTVDVIDETNEVVATIVKTVYVRLKKNMTGALS